MSFRYPSCFLCFQIAILMLLVPTVVSAGPNSNARILIHLASPTSKNACLSGSATPGCDDIDTSGQLDTDYFAYVILSNLSPTAGVNWMEFGITYDGTPSSGVDISSWTGCNTALEYPYAEWPGAGSAIRLVWTSPACLPTVVGQFAMFVTGYLSLSASTPDELLVTPHPESNTASLLSCDNGTADVLNYSTVIPFGWAVFSANGTANGSNPCGYYAGGCHIIGPDSVGINQAGIQYVMKPEEVTSTGSWTVYGNAQVTSSNNSAVTVNPTSPGTFGIVYKRVGDCVEGCGCGRQIQVLATTPVEQTTWGRIKTKFASN